MKATNKLESVNLIKNLRLNSFAEEIFFVKDVEKFYNFIQNNPAKEYCLRDTNKPNGKFFFVKDFDECLNLLHNYENFVTICVSANEYDESIVLLGDIKLTKNFDEQFVDITARCDKDADHRNIYENPDYNLHTDLMNENLWRIPGFSKLLNYVTEHDLYNIVVEFVVYDCPVGIFKENIVIFELRSDY